MTIAPEAIETKPVIRRSDAFEAYVFFKSLPSILRHPPRDRRTGYRPTPREFAQSLGIEDGRLLDLVDLRTQKGFSEQYGVTEQTLVRWNATIAKNNVLPDAQEWATLLTPNVVFSLYSRIINGRGLPQHYKLWFQVVAGWSEKQTISKRTIQTINFSVARPSG